MKKFLSSPLYFALLALVIITLDRLSKLLVQGSVPLAQLKPWIGTTICMTHVHNFGGAFSLFPGMKPVFIFMGFGVLLLITIFLKKIIERGPVWTTAAALFFGGSLGNLVDRVMQGYVIDFIDVRIGGRNVWPIFNVADIAITVAEVILFILLIREGCCRENPGEPHQ